MIVPRFPARLTSARVAAGLSKSGLCRAIGLKSRSVASKWESGEGMPDVATLKSLALALHTTVDYLLGVDQASPISPPVRVELDAVVGGQAPILWSGKLLDPDGRRRAFAILHALLSPVDQLIANPPSVHKEGPNTAANRSVHRAQAISNKPAKRPRTKGRLGDAVGDRSPMDGGD